jgi:hypothetical protein
MKTTKTMEVLLREVAHQDCVLRVARAALAEKGEETVAVCSDDLVVLEETCAARIPAVTRGWLGFRC